jgi:hypothetical protein
VTASQYSNLRVVVAYELYDGIPLMTKSLTATMIASGNPPPPPPPPIDPNALGWSAGPGCTLGYSALTGLALHGSDPTSTPTASYGTASPSVQVTLAGSNPSSKGEQQTNIGMATNATEQGPRELWAIFATCDSGTVYWSGVGLSGRPQTMGPCGLGETMGISPDVGGSGKFAITVNGQQRGVTTVAASSLYPRIQQLPAGLSATHIQPANVPPTPAVDSAVVSGVTVELFGATAGWGAYLSHGSATPGGGWDGEAGVNGPGAMLDFKTDQAHG